MTEKQTSKEAVLSILDPRGIKPELKITPLVPRLDTLKGKTVYVYGFEGFPQIMPEIAKLVPQFAPGANVVDWEDSERSGRGPALVKGKLVEEIVKSADAAIVGNGFWVGAVVAVCSTASAMEKAGIPTVTVYTPAMTQYMEQWQEVFGMPNLRTYASTMPNKHTYQDLARAVIPKLVEGLTTPLTEKEKTGGTIPREERPRIAFTGTYEGCLEFLETEFIPVGTGAPQRKYTAGVSVVLPTPELVAKMLTGTSHSPDEVIGRMLPTGLEFTVEKVAINAVMAGCKPEYLPVVLAFAKVLATEGHLLGQGAAPTLSPVVSGPITKEIGMDFINNTGAGNPANNTIGHAISLMLVNLGAVISGGGAGSILATRQPAAFAEELDSPWTLLGEDVGFKRDQNVVAFIGGGGGGGVMTPPAYRVDGEMRWLEGLTGAVSGAFSPNPTILMNPSIARDLATRQGMSKQDVKQYLYDHCFITKKNYVQRPTRLRPVPKDIEELPDDAKIRVIGNRYGYRSIRTIYSSKDGRVIAAEDTPDSICIVVAGGEEQFGGMAGSPQSPYRNWIESVDVWR